jgi:hypothetical protein
MYETPTLEQYGTFRDLTLGGGSVPSDGFTPNNADGCIPTGSPGPIVGICLAS